MAATKQIKIKIDREVTLTPADGGDTNAMLNVCNKVVVIK
jgi:hypothetical protein